MAEHRFSVFDLATAVAIQGWFVRSTNPHVQQSFYAAIDGGDRLAWTDRMDCAANFPLQEEAELFARTQCCDEAWEVVR